MAIPYERSPHLRYESRRKKRRTQ